MAESLPPKMYGRIPQNLNLISDPISGEQVTVSPENHYCSFLHSVRKNLFPLTTIPISLYIYSLHISVFPNLYSIPAIPERRALPSRTGMYYGRRVIGVMSEKRKQHRNNLIYYLKVFDRDENVLLGHLVDITSEGIMIISEKPVPVQKLFNLRLEFPRDIFGQKELDFSAMSLWSKPDLNPEYHDAGFKLQDVPLQHVLTIKKLVNEYGFND
jgi:hypothetical protein